MRNTIFPLLSFSLLVASCSTFTPIPTATPTQTATISPTETPTPAPTFTSKPPTETPDVVAALLPSGVPDKEWKGIPIMPAAINGEGDDQGYSFTIQASLNEVRFYYRAELTKSGAELFAEGKGEEKGTMIMFFKTDTEVISISIIPHDDLMLVWIVK